MHWRHSISTHGDIPAESISLVPEAPPLRKDEGGVIRVGKTRVSIDVVVEQYENGMTPEDLVRAYDTLALADAYGAIGVIIFAIAKTCRRI